LRADLEDTPVLLDKQYRDRLSNVLSKIADNGRMGGSSAAIPTPTRSTRLG